jgi:hypothetical protein
MIKQSSLRSLLLIAAMPPLLALASISEAATASAPVTLNPRITLSRVEAARLQAAADQGMTALRRYVWRTRMIYNYLISDLI